VGCLRSRKDFCVGTMLASRIWLWSSGALVIFGAAPLTPATSREFKIIARVL
jgi:hypothetical protein